MEADFITERMLSSGEPAAWIRWGCGAFPCALWSGIPSGSKYTRRRPPATCSTELLGGAEPPGKETAARAVGAAHASGLLAQFVAAAGYSPVSLEGWATALASPYWGAAGRGELDFVGFIPGYPKVVPALAGLVRQGKIGSGAAEELARLAACRVASLGSAALEGDGVSIVVEEWGSQLASAAPGVACFSAAAAFGMAVATRSPAPTPQEVQPCIAALDDWGTRLRAAQERAKLVKHLARARTLLAKMQELEPPGEQHSQMGHDAQALAAMAGRYTQPLM